jgi:hypothetical protein
MKGLMRPDGWANQLIDFDMETQADAMRTKKYCIAPLRTRIWVAVPLEKILLYRAKVSRCLVAYRNETARHFRIQARTMA